MTKTLNKGIKNVKQIEELTECIEQKIEFYKNKEKDDYVNHYKTRRFGAVSFLFGVLGFVIATVDKLAGLHVYVIDGVNFMSPNVTGTTVIFIALTAILLLYLAKSKTMSCFVISIYFICNMAILLTSNSATTGYISAGVYLSLYICCFGLNRQQGYTRLWARHQRVMCQLQLLKWDVSAKASELINCDSCIKIRKLEAIVSKARIKYLDILEKHAFERQADIVGDYLSTNDAAFSWIKSLKK